MSTATAKTRPKTDTLLQTIADYVCRGPLPSQEAYQTARACLADTLGCGILALQYPECVKLLGPVIPGTQVPGGARVPGTSHVLDPIRAAFNIGAAIRWLDYNDTWLAAEWGHPSDNLGGILAVADTLSQQNGNTLTVREVLTAMIRAHEIQGVLALKNSFNRVGFDHVILVKVATAAVVTHLLGGDRDQVADALSQAWVDTGPLRAYRHAPNTGPRKSWAAGDATARGVQLAWFTLQGEMGYPSALTAPKWGLQDVLFQGKPLVLERELGCYVMENVLFKISFPAEFHAQTAVEAAITLHSQVRDRLDEIAGVEITTHESAIRIIDKTGPLHNPADRDHCLQYMIACGLIYGELNADHYEDKAAADPRIDALREKMTTRENPAYSRDYLDPQKRSIANALVVKFKDGRTTERVEVEYPIGHRRRRKEGLPLLYEKCRKNLTTLFSPSRVDELMNLFEREHATLDDMPVRDFVQKLIP